MCAVPRGFAENGGYDRQLVAGAELTRRPGTDCRIDTGTDAHFDLRSGPGGAGAYFVGAEIFSRGSRGAHHAPPVPLGNLLFESGCSRPCERVSGSRSEARMSPVDTVELTIDGRKLSVA